MHGQHSSLINQTVLPNLGLNESTTLSEHMSGPSWACKHRHARAFDAFDAQKQFLANVEDAISSPVDLPSAIARYQDVLRYAGSKVDFVFGIGLYMAPSDMELLAGGATIQNYNNEIVIAGPGQIMGMNGGINVAPLPAPDSTGETGLIKAQTPHPVEYYWYSGDFGADTTVPAAQPARPAVSAVEQAEGQAHSDGLTALVVGVVALGLGWLALR